MEQAADRNPEDREMKMKERVQKLKETHQRLKESGLHSAVVDKDEIEELENVPAYIRRKVDLNDTKPSEDEEVSRYRLSDEGGDGEGPSLRSDNSYLHDNVD